MRYRPLGQSGIDASVVGFGAWALGGWMWGGTDPNEPTQALHAAIDAGINLVDTAPIYGFGHSEEVVGKAIHDRRDKVVLATKCGMVVNTMGGEEKFRSSIMGPDPKGQISVRLWLNPDSIRQELEQSLKRLRTDYIDLYQTHWQERTTAIEDTMAGLLDMKQEGKIRAIGVSNATPEQMDEYRRHGPLDSDQERYSMLDRQLEEKQLPYCEKNNIAVLAYSPLGQGLLTGKMGPDREFSEGDLRHGKPRFSVENRKRVAAMLDRFKGIAEEHGVTMAQLSIAWTVHQPGLTHALCGARRPDQAVENAGAGEVTLSDEELATMLAAIEEYERAGA